MCSLIDFIENQNFFIQTQHKQIQYLSKFLNEFDKQLTNELICESNQIEKPSSRQLRSNETTVNSDARNAYNVPNIVDKHPIKSPIKHKDLQNSDDLMFSGNEELSWLSSYEEKRKRLAEERRKEYNEYLKEKSRIESERQKRYSKNMTATLAPNYYEILHKKRIEERKHREVNGMNNIEEMQCEDQMPNTYNRDSQCIIGWSHHFNNKFVPECITPRSRLLATHSSRVRAAQYREELRQQIEEKKRIQAEERQRIRLEEIELERKIEEQQLKLMREYEEEQRNLKKKTNEVLKRQEMSKMMSKKPNDIYPSASPLSVLRSPSYLQAREARILSPHKKNNKVSRSLLSSMQSTATQTKQPNINIPISGLSRNKYKSGKSSDSSAESSSDSEPEAIPEQLRKSNRSLNSEYNQNGVLRPQSSEHKSDGRVMSQLTEVRQMMENDHIKMLEQLRTKQVQQQLNDQIF